MFSQRLLNVESEIATIMLYFLFLESHQQQIIYDILQFDKYGHYFIELNSPKRPIFNMYSNEPFKLAQYLITPQEYTIEAPHGDVSTSQPKVIDVLSYLASQYPAVVTREQLIDLIWKGNYLVGEKALTNAIWNLRNELRYIEGTSIETIRKKGYRLLIAPTYYRHAPAQQKQLDKNNLLYKGLLYALGISAMVLLIFISQNTPFHFSSNDIKISSVSSQLGREVYPAISPNSRYLVYSWRRMNKPPNLFLRDLSDAAIAPIQLTHSNDYESVPVWAPNGKEIYFQKKRWDYSQCHIIKLNLLTHRQTVLAPCTGEVDFSLSITPDGRLLSFIAPAPVSQRLTVHILKLADTDSSSYQAAPLYNCQTSCNHTDLDSEFSPDGKHLVIARTLNEAVNEELYLYTFATGKLTPLTSTQGIVKGMAWHPSGDRIIYSSEIFGQRESFVISLNTFITNALEVSGLSYPQFIPQSTNLIFHDWHVLSRISFLSIHNSIASSPFPLLKSDHTYHSPHYSPIAHRIAYVSNESGFNELWLSNTDGSARQMLTTLQSQITAPRWSHDGQLIAFLAQEKNSKYNSLNVYDVKKRSWHKIISKFKRHGRPSWTRDDLALLAPASLNNQTNLYTFTLNDAIATKVMEGNVTFAQQDSDNAIIYSAGRNKGLWRLDPLNGEKDQILDQTTFRVNYNWALTDNGVYFRQDYVDHIKINLFDTKSQTIKHIVKLPTGTMLRASSISYIKEENKLLFSQLEFPKTDIKELAHPLLD